jgi:hypothetical protein
MVRADRSASASDPDGAGAIKFVTMGTGFHATNPQAAVYWNPANTATGNYTVKGTFTLIKPSGHTNYYGLVFGGGDLDGARLIALNMALNGESRADTERYLAENFQLPDRLKLIDEVYSAIEG